MAHWRIRANGIAVILVTICEVVVLSSVQAHASSSPKGFGHTRVSIKDTRWHLNGHQTYPASQAEGLLMNVRMVNAVFEDRKRLEFVAVQSTQLTAFVPSR